MRFKQPARWASCLLSVLKDSHSSSQGQLARDKNDALLKRVKISSVKLK